MELVCVTVCLLEIFSFSFAGIASDDDVGLE